MDYLTCEPTEANFRKFVDYLFSAKREGSNGFAHAAMGLAGESGEVLDHCKKHWVYDREVDVDKVIEEMGDTLHYFFQLMIKMEEILEEPFELTDVIQDNMVKLRKRYPDGFSKEAAIARADKVEG
jgi:NTP pyrophosphatase (non-canonical NTP hydrolase)